MKNTLWGLTMVIAISPGLALAQRPGPGGFGRDPQMWQQRRIDFLVGHLNLTDSQKQQATSIFNAADEASKELRKSLEQAQEGLDNAVKTSATEEQIDKLARTMGTLVGQLAATQTKATAKFRALLTAEQGQRFDQLPGPRLGMMMRSFGGGPPPGPRMGMPPGPRGENPPPPGPPGPPPPPSPPEPPASSEHPDD
jgi:Spy/CpxP family protein refolding chaperone